MLLKDLSIKAQLAVVIAVMSILLIAIGATGLLGMSAAVQINRQLTEERLPKIVSADTMLIWIARQRTSLDQAALTTEPAWAELMYKTEGDSRKEALNAWAAYKALPQTEEGKVLVNRVSDGLGEVQQSITNFSTAIKRGDRQTIADAARALGKAYTDMQGDGKALNKYESEQADKILLSSTRLYENSRDISIIAIVIGLMVTLCSWLSLRKAIAEPISRTLRHLDAIAHGDLTQPVHVHSKNEMGQLLAGLSNMQNNLTNTVRAVHSGSEAIATATRQISSGNLDLSSRTEEQAASLEQTAASMSQLSETVRQTAENTRLASQLSKNAYDISEDSSTRVHNLLGTMDDIKTSSSKITDIISLIEGIAFQTNILALNAAVEAARAGEQGRGFAVVAGEVRNLAQRSSSSAKEIKELIESSMQFVKAGVNQAEGVGHNMSRMNDSVRQVTDLIDEISVAAHEQSQGIEQVHVAVNQMDDVTQQNSALVQEASAALLSLMAQASALNKLVSTFTVGELENPERKYETEQETQLKLIQNNHVVKNARSDDDWKNF